MRQHSSVRQRFRYFGVIAMTLMVTVGLFWGLAHISKIQLGSTRYLTPRGSMAMIKAADETTIQSAVAMAWQNKAPKQLVNKQNNRRTQ
jgi:hypothetical protein